MSVLVVSVSHKSTSVAQLADLALDAAVRHQAGRPAAHQ